MGWLSRLLGRGRSLAADLDRLRALEAELQAVRLTLQEREDALANLLQNSARERKQESDLRQAALSAQKENILTDLGAVLSQFATIVHLTEVKEQKLSSNELLSVIKRLFRIMAEHGLTVEGEIGSIVPYDPGRHQPMSLETKLAPGEQIMIHRIGFRCDGKIVSRAGVEKMEE